jgi:acetolactate synthase I/III small subunit
MHHSIVVALRDEPGALDRIVGLLRRKGFRIESVVLAPGECDGIRRATFVVVTEEPAQLLAQLRRLIDVVEVEALPADSPFERETALLGVRAPAATRPEIVALCSVFGARVLDVGAVSMVIEVTASPASLARFLDLIRPYGLDALMRTGRIALRRDAVASHIDARGGTAADPRPATARAG